MKVPEEATKHYKRMCESKRLNVICELLREGDRVLDVGCGVGNYISNPLSWLPVKITAIDFDPETIAYARKRNKRSNIKFLIADGETYTSKRLFDFIICSNVLEHMIEPKIMLNNMKSLLKDDGLLYVGLPNGFWAFEFQNLAPRLLSKTNWGNRLVERLRNGQVKDTLNVESQHVQFFTVHKAERLLKENGWKILKRVNEEFLGGIVFDRLFPKFPSLAKWNVNIADRLPAQLTNGWVFICKKN